MIAVLRYATLLKLNIFIYLITMRLVYFIAYFNLIILL